MVTSGVGGQAEVLLDLRVPHQLVERQVAVPQADLDRVDHEVEPLLARPQRLVGRGQGGGPVLDPPLQFLPEPPEGVLGPRPLRDFRRQGVVRRPQFLVEPLELLPPQEDLGLHLLGAGPHAPPRPASRSVRRTNSVTSSTRWMMYSIPPPAPEDRAS